MQINRSVRQNIIDLAATMGNHTEHVWPRQARSRTPSSVGAAVATILKPVLEDVGRKILSVFGLCKDHEANIIESLHQSLRESKERINQLCAETQTAIFALNGKADATQKNLRQLSADVQTNCKRIQGKISQMLK